MGTETYRARWIDAAGTVVREDTFNYGYLRGDRRDVYLAIDAPYFYPDGYDALRAHLHGYIEVVVIDGRTVVIVNDDGALRDGWVSQPHPDVLAAAERHGQRLVGPVVLVTRETPDR
jgi:hypothetical protein